MSEVTAEINAKAEEKHERMKKENADRKAKALETAEVLRENKGKLELSIPLLAADEELTELEYDFNALTGMDLANAMDYDQSSSTVYRISTKQSLAMFAAAVSKCTPSVDTRDVMERLSAADAVMGVQLAVRFFNSSTSAGRLRISKK